MGAALTYARRYALFTLVGIAGEDDLDAPDLAPGTTPRATGNKKGRFDGGQGQSGQQFSSGRSVKATAKPPRAILASEASTVLRDRLMAELNDLNSAESAANWARRALSAKNSLTANDADWVEQAFQSRLSIITQAAGGGLAHEAEPRLHWGRRAKKRRRAAVVNKSALMLPAPPWIRDREHVKSVAKQPCLICGRQPADAHHLRFAQSRALGCKVSDEFTVPLCRGHHREAHRSGDEVAWWEKTGIDPLSAARTLWLETHQLQSAKVI
jgi:ERF superfamily